MTGSGQLTEADARRFLDRGGLWQWRQLVILMFSFTSSATQAFLIVFAGFQPSFKCLDGYHGDSEENKTISEIYDDTCHAPNVSMANTSGSCQSGFHYSVHRHESIVSEWDLVCDKAYLSEVSQLLYTVGMGVGALTIGPVCDRLGRKRSFHAARFLCLGCSVAIIFAPGIVVFIVFRFFIGMLEMMCGLMRGVFITELASIKIRPITTTLAGIVWALALCFQSLVGHFLRGHSWRYMQVMATGAYITVILELVVIKESLVWLYANGRSEQAAVILKSAMKTNGITKKDLMSDCREDVELTELLLENQNKKPQDKNVLTCGQENSSEAKPGDEQIILQSCLEVYIPKEKNTISLLDVIRNKATRGLILIICCVWFVNSLVYYGLFLMTSAMVGDRILNFFIVAAVEIPACSGIYGILRFFGRRKALIGCHAVCGICLVLAGLFNFTLSGQTKVIAMQVVTFLGKFGISATFLMLYFYTTETLPTNFRTSGLGIASFTARCGSLLSPFSSVLLRVLPWGPGVIFGGLCLVVAGLLFLVPDSANRNLPQTLTEIEQWKESEKGKQRTVDIRMEQDT